MKNNNFGGTLIGIIIGMLILTFIALSIINIVSFNKDIVDEYQVQTDKNILKQNTNNILKKIDLSKVKEGETFYINKNETTKIFEVFTGVVNEQYKYIDNLGNKVNDITSFDKKIYVRDLKLSTDIIKKIAVTSVKPSSFAGLIIHYDAQDTDGDGNKANEPNNLTTLNTWINKAGLPNASSVDTPTYTTDSINTFPAISFNGTTDYYTIIDHTNINTAASYQEKSFALVFKTGNDFTTPQMVLYGQGNTTNGYLLGIENGKLLIGLREAGVDKKIDLGALEINTSYYIIMTQSASGILKGYLNGKIKGTILGVNDIGAHASSPPTSLGLSFNGSIGELISWNHSLTDSEVIDLKKYIEEKWNMGKASILDNVNISIIVKDINLTTPH